MQQQEPMPLRHLRELGIRPAVPFHESGPAEYIAKSLKGLGVSVRRDRYGNVIARYRKAASTKVPAVALVAHMDHPGFEVVEASDSRVVARVLGGVPVCSLSSPMPVLVLMPDGRRVPALTSPFDGQPPAGERYVLFNLPIQTPLSPSLPAVFDLPDFVLSGDTIRMRALDDLAGCAAVLAVLEHLATQGAEADVYGVFTRAEESGLYGARLLAEARTLPRKTVIVSVESSAVIPGVAQSEGPVIRVGDAAWTFDADAEQALLAACDTVRKRRPDFKVQRALMSGGTCEATAFALTGYRTTGVAFPLGNYHNATTRIADPSGGVDAEFIRVSDFLDGVELLTEATLAVARGDQSPIRRRLGPVPYDVRQRLVDSRTAR